MNGHADSIGEAVRARAEAERRYRRLVEMGGSVRHVQESSADMQRRNHFAESIENLLAEGVRRRARGL